MKPAKYCYSTKSEFLSDIEKLSAGLPFSDDTGVLASSITVNNHAIPNRLLAQPIEGFDCSHTGTPGARTLNRYKELALGGSGAIWMESIAVNHEGKSNTRQMQITADNLEAFRSFIQSVHHAGQPYIIGQLTHSGRYSNPDGNALAICAYENPHIPKEHFRIISDKELELLREDYISAAFLAKEAGFDAVDIRACHGYLLNELLSAYHRPGKYGGSYENRTRLLKEIVQTIHQKHQDLTICVRLNITDGIAYPFGWGQDPTVPDRQSLHEPLRLVSELQKMGVSIFNISAGIGACSPYMIRPYDSGGPTPPEHPLEGIERLLLSAKAVKETVPDSCVVASGFSWLRDFAPMVAAGGIKEGWFDLVGFGRQWIACPDYANSILNRQRIRKVCVACGGCSALIKKSGKELRCIR